MGGRGGQLAAVDLADGAVDGDPVAFVNGFLADNDAPFAHVDLELGDAHHGGFAELPGHQGGVAGAASPAGENALGGQHAVHVVGLGFRPHHDDRASLVLGPVLRQIGFQGHHPHRRPGGDVEPAGQHLAHLTGRLNRLQAELGVEEEIHLIRRYPQHGFLLGDQALFGHIHGDAHGRLGGALAVAGLEHPETCPLRW